MKVGDLVRMKYEYGEFTWGEAFGVVFDEDEVRVAAGFRAYYRIYILTHNQTIWGEAEEWEVLSESR